MSDTIELNGITYDADEVTERTLVIKGQQPTDYEGWEYVEVLAELRKAFKGFLVSSASLTALPKL